MREARIVMPKADHIDGWLETHLELEAALVDQFGGCTVTNGTGSWRAPDGSVERKPVVIYDVAVDETEAPDADGQVLRDLAIEAATALDQRAAYIRYPSGAVDIIDTDNAQVQGMPPAAKSEPKPGARPAVGELWRTRDGSIVAVVARAGSSYRPYTLKCIVLRPAPHSREVDYLYVAMPDGGYNEPRDTHPLDLVERAGTF